MGTKNTFSYGNKRDSTIRSSGGLENVPNQSPYFYGIVTFVDNTTRAIQFTTLKNNIGTDKIGDAIPFYKDRITLPEVDDMVPLLTAPSRECGPLGEQDTSTVYYLDPISTEQELNKNSTIKSDSTSLPASVNPSKQDYLTALGGFPRTNDGITTNIGPLTNFQAEIGPAKKLAELYLGRVMSDSEWNQLVKATYAESGRDKKETAYVMGVILNRTRSGKFGGSAISDVLNQRSQFQSVTGTKKDGHASSSNFINGPSKKVEKNIYDALTLFLQIVPKTYKYFTAASIKAYGPGTNPNFRNTLLAKGGEIIGQSIFSSSA